MKTVLIVENNQLILDLLCLSLQEFRDSFRVKSGRDGAEAYTILQHEQIDLLITDLIMPVVSGFELISYANKAYPDLPIIVISASVPKMELAMETYTIRHFFLKPFSLDHLIATIHVELGLEVEVKPLSV